MCVTWLSLARDHSTMFKKRTNTAKAQPRKRQLSEERSTDVQDGDTAGTSAQEEQEAVE